MEFKANSGMWGAMFGVPCVVADNFLKLATGDQLKVLLYLLRCSGRAASSEEIAASTGVTPEQAEEAVLFWQQVNVLTTDVPAAAQSLMSPPQLPSEPVQPAPKEDKQIVRPKRERLLPSDISGMMKDNKEIAQLFKVAEETLGHINNTMQNTLIWMLTYLGLKKEVIVILISYCSMIERRDPRYIEEIAISWAEKEINTLELAQEEVERLTMSRTFTSAVMRIFEMNRKPTTRQQEFIEKWRAEGFSHELLRLAYEKTIEAIDKLSFDYINKILMSWKENGYSTPDDVKNGESSYRKSRKSDAKPSDGFNADKYKIFINNI